MERKKATKKSFSKKKSAEASPKQIIEIIPLSGPERLWMEEVYEKAKLGQAVHFKQIWSKLYKKLPKNFRPLAMDERLISANGEELRLLGVVAVEKSYAILKKVDKVIDTVRDMMIENYENTNILIDEIGQRTNLSVSEISLALHLVRDYGTFYTGSSYTDGRVMKSIDVGRDDNLFYNYMDYPGIESPP